MLTKIPGPWFVVKMTSDNEQARTSPLVLVTKVEPKLRRYLQECYEDACARSLCSPFEGLLYLHYFWLGVLWYEYFIDLDSLGNTIVEFDMPYDQEAYIVDAISFSGDTDIVSDILRSRMVTRPNGIIFFKVELDINDNYVTSLWFECIGVDSIIFEAHFDYENLIKTLERVEAD